MEPDASAVKPEPGSPAESSGEADDGETSFSDLNVKTESASPDLITKIETDFLDLPIEFEPRTDAEDGFDFTDREINIKVENEACSSEITGSHPNPRLSGVQSGGVSSTSCLQHTTLETKLLPRSKQALKECSHHTDDQKSQVQTKLPAAQDKAFACSVCNHQFSRKYFKSHMLIHTGEERFSCPDCSYSSNKKENLGKHLLSHTGEKPFSCTTCGRKYNNKSSFRRHMLTHTKEIFLNCSECNYTCTTQKRLKNHMLKQHGQKRFSCPSCSYTCSKKANITNHLLTHTGEKPFSCSECVYKCTQKGNLRSHISSKHTGVKPFSCSDCAYRCSTKRVLKLHRLTHT